MGKESIQITKKISPRSLWGFACKGYYGSKSKDEGWRLFKNNEKIEVKDIKFTHKQGQGLFTSFSYQTMDDVWHLIVVK